MWPQKCLVKNDPLVMTKQSACLGKSCWVHHTFWIRAKQMS